MKINCHAIAPGTVWQLMFRLIPAGSTQSAKLNSGPSRVSNFSCSIVRRDRLSFVTEKSAIRHMYARHSTTILRHVPIHR